MELKVIARIKSGFPAKFGIPRQSGLVQGLTATITFEPEYRNADALRGLETFSHIWLIWGFSEAEREDWSPTVRPPRLGGNVRKGVFATRSPFRPNSIGLSSVKLLGVKKGVNGVELIVEGADLMDGTPIYDIKPYLPYVDCHADAVDGFAAEVKDYELAVTVPDNLANKLPDDTLKTVIALLKQDPRPSYQRDPDRTYGFIYDGYEIKFTVTDGKLTVKDIEKATV